VLQCVAVAMLLHHLARWWQDGEGGGVREGDMSWPGAAESACNAGLWSGQTPGALP
jgi:hypothetical protein